MVWLTRTWRRFLRMCVHPAPFFKKWNFLRSNKSGGGREGKDLTIGLGGTKPRKPTLHHPAGRFCQLSCDTYLRSRILLVAEYPPSCRPARGCVH